MGVPISPREWRGANAGYSSTRLLEVKIMTEEQNVSPDMQNPGNGENINAETQGTANVGDPTIFEKAASTAGAAAGSLRRGELMDAAAVDPEASSDDRLIALLSYGSQIFIPLIMPLIILISESSKKRPFQRYHAVQSLALSLAFMGVFAAAGMGAAIASFVPFIGWAVGFAAICLTPILYMMGVIAMIYYGYQAYQGKRFAIPGLTTFLKDQGWID
jgi:uncharacterized membrane protein